VLFIAFYLRFVNLRTNPPWLGDECLYLNLTKNLLQGKLEFFAFRHAFAITGRLPLFFLVFAPIMWIFGNDIIVLRMFTVMCGIISIFFIFLIGKELINYRLGLLAGFFYSIYPFTIKFNRWGFSHNMSLLIFVMLVYFVLKWFKTKKILWGYLCAIFAGLASVNEYYGFFFLLFPIIFGFYLVRSRLIRLVFISFLPLALFVFWGIFFSSKLFLEDLKSYFVFIFMVREKNLPSFFVIAVLKEFFYIFLQVFRIGNIWLLGGLLGYYLYDNKSLKKPIVFIVLGLFLFIIVLSLFYHHYLTSRIFILIIPFLVLGTGIFILKFLDRFYLFPSAIMIIFLFLFSTIYYDIEMMNSSFPTGLSKIVAKSVEDTEKTARYINANTDLDDFVIASPTLGWLLESKVALFIQVLKSNDLYFGLENMSAQRFVFNPDFLKAKFVVIDESTKGFTTDFVPPVKKIVKEVETKWKLNNAIGEYKVYKNPNLL
jgi:4-amino-4-deoxy-L-arabinose transferase-like glycosyltransferase